jgi:ABC-type phosphate transport system permease subunit
LFAEYVQPALAGTLGQIPGIGILFTGAFNGVGILAAGLILAMMILPFIASVMRDVFEIVPPYFERVSLRYWLHHLGSGYQNCVALHQRQVSWGV